MKHGEAWGRPDMGEVHRLLAPEPAFGLLAAGRLMIKIFPPWVQDLALLVGSVEVVRPPGAASDWQPGAVVRLPFSKKICSDGEAVCSQALMLLAAHDKRPVGMVASAYSMQ